MVLPFFDRVRINTVFHLKDLLAIPRLRDLKNRNHIQLNHSSSEARKRGYESRIEFSAPTRDILEQVEISLEECASSAIRLMPSQGVKKLTKYYSISKVEIARDFITETEQLALLMADELIDKTILAYQYRFKLFDADNNRSKAKNSLKKEVFSKKTAYWGNPKSFEYVVYARNSKVNKLPCCHTEFRIKCASTIREKTGISSINDLKNFNFKRFFEKMDSDVLRYAEIDLEAFSRWVMGYDGRRTLTPRQEKWLPLAGHTYLNVHKINTTCRNHCQEDQCQSLACAVKSASKLRELIRDGSLRNNKNQPLGNKKYQILRPLPITIYDISFYKK